MRSAKVPDVLDSCGDISIKPFDEVTKYLTLCEDLPFARLASRRVGKYLVEFIEKVLHLTTALPLGHLVADAQLRSSAIVSTALGHGIVVEALKTGNAAVLHGVVVSC